MPMLLQAVNSQRKMAFSPYNSIQRNLKRRVLHPSGVLIAPGGGNSTSARLAPVPWRHSSSKHNTLLILLPFHKVYCRRIITRQRFKFAGQRFCSI
jgi:hypothetical protein